MSSFTFYRLKTYAFCLLAFTPLLMAGQQFDKISHTSSNGMDIWEIKNPNVKKKEALYPQVTYKEGDQIVVTAGGCVQTGGRGKTWKRYVNPKPESDKLYYGLIYIPGMTQGWERLSKVVGKPHRIPVKADIPDKLIVRLGYKDDGYDDNGYNDHDNGVDDQCKGIGNAFVVIKILHQ